MGKPTRIAVVGIDGSGKSSVIRCFGELSPAPPGEVVVMTCPTYHETPNAPMATLSRQLDALSKTGDALGSFELKATAMFLQMTLYGPIERFFLETYQPEYLLSEHNALIDCLGYGAFYVQMVRNPIDRQKIESPLRQRMDAFMPHSFDEILQWHELESRRIGERVSFWNLAPHASDLLQRPRSSVIQELGRRFRTTLPEIVLLLDVPADVAMARLRARGDSGGELHEQSGFLELLRRSYHEVVDYLQREHPEIQAYIIDTESAQSVDHTLQAVLQRTGIPRI